MIASARTKYFLVALSLLALLVGGLAVSLATAQTRGGSQRDGQEEAATASDQLFAGSGAITEPAYLIDVITGSATPTFTGSAIYGAAYDPIGDRILFNVSDELWQWLLNDDLPSFIGQIISASNGSNMGMESLAYTDGTLYGTTWSGDSDNPEGIYSIDFTTAVATLFIAFPDPSLTYIQGLAVDPATGIIYGTNNDSSLLGLVQIDLDGSLTLVAPYPDGVTDIDGLAIGNGLAYLITDGINAPGDDIYVYDLTAGAYTTPLPAPWTSWPFFSKVGAAYVPYRPRISLEQTVGTDANACAAYSELSVPPGSAVTYCYTITNATTTTLALHDLTDSQLGQLLDGYPLALPPGSATFITETTTITTDTLSSATWTAYNPGPTDVYSDTAAASVSVGPPEPLLCNGPAIQFEQGRPGDWQVRDNIGLGEVWSHTNSAILPGDCNEDNYSGGSGLAACASGGQFDDDFDTELWSNPFSIPAGHNLVQLDYLANYANDPDWGDALELAISSDGGSSWSRLLLWQEDHGG